MRNFSMILTAMVIAITCTACGSRFDSTFGDGGLGGSGGTGGEGATTSSGGSGGAGGDSCSDNEELCDGVDNNCNGEADEGLDFCLSMTVEPHTDSVGAILVVDSDGEVITSSKEPFDEVFTVYLDSPRTLYLRLEQPTLTVDASAISIDMETYGYGCSEGDIQIPVNDMQSDLEAGEFSKSETFLECYMDDTCAVQHIQGCGNGEIHTLRLDVAPKL